MSHDFESKPQDRRLTLLPEILPAPRQLDRSTGVRSRTLAHLRHLMATAAAAAAISAACVPEKVDRPQGAGPLNPDLGKPAPPVDLTPPDTRGYMVVDMLPPPALCSGLAASVETSAVWERMGADWVVRMAIGQSTRPGGTIGIGTPQSRDGRILSVEAGGDGTLVIRWKPDHNEQTSGALLLPARCGTEPQSISVTMELGSSGNRRVGETVWVALFDTIR